LAIRTCAARILGMSPRAFRPDAAAAA